MAYIITYSGINFDPLEPDEQKIRIEDIAHSLSLLCRANGHFRDFYSVGRHSINCAAEAKARGLSARTQLACLLHDATEAYISDLTRPVKAELPEYRLIENSLQNAIFRRFGLAELSGNEVSLTLEIDDTMLYYEFLHFMDTRISAKRPIVYSEPRYESYPFAVAETEFLKAAGPLIIQVKTKKDGSN